MLFQCCVSSPAITEKGTPCPLGMKKPIGPQEKDMDAFGFLYKLSGGGHDLDKATHDLLGVINDYFCSVYKLLV